MEMPMKYLHGFLVREVLDTASRGLDNSEDGIEPRNDFSLEPYIPKPEHPIFYLLFLVKLVTFLLGVIGNGLLVLVFIRHRGMRTSTNTYIFSIAITDLIVTLTCPWIMMVTDITAGSWALGVFTCKFSQTSMEFATCATVLSLTVVSIERYYAVVYPIERHISSQRFTVATNILIWIVAILFSLPKFINSDVIKKTVNGIQGHTMISYCVLTDDKNFFTRYFSLFDVFIFYVIPFCIVCVLYSSMARHLLNKGKTPDSEKCVSLGHIHQTRLRIKVAKMVMVLTIIFFLGFLPYNILRLRIYFLGGTDTYWNSAAAYAYCFGCLHFWLNPIAMYMYCGTFRKHYNSYFFCLSTSWKAKVPISKSQIQMEAEETTVTSVSAGDRSSQLTEDVQKCKPLQVY